MPDLPPFLTEQWATAYFQVLFSVLVFAVGIPFLGIQLIMQEDVRHVVTYRTWKIRLWAALVIALLFSNILFIWIIHPATLDKADVPTQVSKNEPLPVSSGVTGDNGRDGAAEQLRASESQPADSVLNQGQPKKPVPVGAAPSDAATPTHPPAEQYQSPVPGPSPIQTASPNESEDNVWPWYQSMIAGLIVTVIPIAALTLGYWLPSTFTRKKVIKQFEADLISSIKKHRRPKPDTLLNLTYLGEHGNPGIEKQLVLESFKRVASALQDEPGYKGRELAEMIKSISPILLNTEKPGNDENHKFAANLLHTIWRKVSGKYSYLDAMLAATTLKQLGLEAVMSKSDETALRYVSEGALCDDSIVFELGVLAVRTGRFNVAMDALRNLEVMAFADEIQPEDRKEATHSLLGLLANFIAAGEASRRRAESFLTRERSAFVPSLEVCIKEATDYHFIKADFFTADKILAMERELTATAANYGTSIPLPALPTVPLQSEPK